MARQERAKNDELDEMITASDEDLQSLVTAYEPLEAAYREATASGEVFPEVVNTTTLPRALITTTTSAR